MQRRATRCVANQHHNTSPPTEMVFQLLQRRAKIRLMTLYKIIHNLIEIPYESYLLPSTSSYKHQTLNFQRPCSFILDVGKFFFNVWSMSFFIFIRCIVKQACMYVCWSIKIVSNILLLAFNWTRFFFYFHMWITFITNFIYVTIIPQ